jgi:polyferredoxin
MEHEKNSFTPVLNVNLSQMKDTGMAFTLICLLLAAFTGIKLYLTIGIILLFINMINSRFFHYPAIFWFTLSNLLSVFVSKILLSIIFFGIITPVGLLRKLYGLLRSPKTNSNFDSLKLKQWKKSSQSVLKTRNYQYSKKDLINPY